MESERSRKGWPPDPVYTPIDMSSGYLRNTKGTERLIALAAHVAALQVRIAWPAPSYNTRPQSRTVGGSEPDRPLQPVSRYTDPRVTLATP